jgi:hypothetical protein
MSITDTSTRELQDRKERLEYLAMMAKNEQVELGDSERQEHAAIVAELARRGPEKSPPAE